MIPIEGPGSGQRSFLVLFEEVGRPPAPVPPAPRGKTAQLRQIAQMEQELQALRHYHRAAEEEQAANNEELQSANEEILSSNKELQSINEELETSKEELQSANEELVTLNEELQNRNVELQRLHDDLDNFIGSAAFPMVMLGPDLALRRFTPPAARLLSLIPADIGRPLGRLRIGVEIGDLERLALTVMETMIPDEREIRDQEGHWWRLQVRPYQTRENTIDGAVVALVDIEALKKTQAVVEEARDFADAIVSTARVPLLILDAGLRVRQANRSFYELFRSSPQETEGVRIWELGDRQWNDPNLRKMLEDVLPRDSSFEDYAMSADFPSVGTRTLVLNGRKLRQIAGKEELILLAVEDRTAAAQAEAERRELLHAQEMVRAAEAANRLKDEFVATASHELRGPLNALVGWAHILSSGTLDEATAARGWAAIKRSVETQTRLIEDC